MINPLERFDAFSSNRLNKRDVGSGYQLSSSYTIGPKTHALFTFFHLINRSVTSAPWLFYLHVFFIAIQLYAATFAPYNTGVWNGKYPKLDTFFKICTIIIRYIPKGSSDTAEYVVFAIAAVLTVMNFSLFISIILTLKVQESANMKLKIFFFYNFFFYPIFQSCFISITTKNLYAIIVNPSIGAFFLSAAALIVLLLLFFMSGLTAIATASSPAPNVANPISVWAPNSWDSVVFYFMVTLVFVCVEYESALKGTALAVVLIVRCIGSSILGSYHVARIYYINYFAYQFITSCYMTFNIYIIILIISVFHPGIVPYWAVIVVFVFLVFALFFIFKLYTHIRIKKFMKNLKNAQKLDPTDTKSSKRTDDEDEPLLDQFSDLKLGNSMQALFAVRAACILGLDCFADGSIVKYVLHNYPDLQFEMLYMNFLIPDNLNFLKQLIDSFLSRNTPKFLEAAILFQLVTSIQESSNELSSEISHEISKNSLAGFKCEQILSKFWAGCYKGDISQMSRSTFMLHQNIYELSENWRQLVIRYPYSTPTLKEYIKFLNGIGRQHRLAETLIKVHPKLSDNASSNINQTQQDNEINMTLLHMSIEDAVDRRPLSSLYHAKIRLYLAVILAIIFIIAAIVLAFIFIYISSGMSSYLYYSDTTLSLIFHSPNLFEKIKNNESDSREIFFNHAKTLDTSMTMLLTNTPFKVLKSNSELDTNLTVQVINYKQSEKVGIVKFLRLYSYFARSIPFVETNDTLVTLMKNNTFGIGYAVFLASDAELVSIQSIINSLRKYINIFYGVTWGIMILFMVSLIYLGLQNVRNELKYIFNLYLTIPRSLITEFMDGNGSKKENAHRVFSSNILQTNTFDDVDDAQQNQEQNDYKAVDNLKLLVHDQTSSSTVIPKHFSLKVWLILGCITLLLMISATVEVFLFTQFVSEMMLCFRTLQMTSQRTTGCSIALQGLLSNFTTFSRDYCVARLQLSKDFNNKLLFAVDENISKKMLTSSDYYSIVHDHPCEDDANMSCWPFNHLFDYYMILASKAFNSTISDSEMNTLVNLYNDYLYPKSVDLHEIGYEYIVNQFKREQIIILLIFFIIIIVVIFTGFVFLRPIIKQLDSTIEAVKLPLKFIPPIKVPDLPKIMLYLQGEADWQYENFLNLTETDNSRFGNYLNILEYPHAIFEEDKTLLFANPPFYSLIGAPREACIGLSMESIFSRVINFKNDDKHPFHDILRFADGAAQQTCTSITTSFERQGRKMKNVEIHLTKIESEENKHVFIMSFDDLSYHDHLEEITRYERQIAENLKHMALPAQLFNALNVDGILKARSYENTAMSSFSIGYASIKDEYDGELADGCSLFMKSVKEVSGVFPNIVKIVQEPPHFIFFLIPEENEQLDVIAIQMVHFMNAVINSFNSSTQKFKISGIMLVGQIMIIPMKTKLPVMECFGSGYRVLIQTRMKIKNSGKFYVTKDTASLLTEQKTVTFSEECDSDLYVVNSRHMDD
ncbi:hypothetical protein TVAG_527150 [Trichomonas vaginalis G3]|uniref:PAS domain-containing protein n=1 Tax=Trichomonas vaginalis (strain ATCC PRA-98 / G3) TaxID=412133 RepID=A2G842_TRIV3|nr:hypothetical protein TVAGG3_0805970 [Trichomonas vaginalis G3]EAX86671.1 hypothetical protein TVAG_527150 [Trichomonas vaginalis G3]KAI5496861.1 hypothetical protein TVAGG3_0805970 [Trichomonas vaginalis G3]|eukprot:XP_001299601.1 hypothetical protein [Trichomonas vaginalis G3]